MFTDRPMGISNQRPAWNKRRKLVFINGCVHRADYTRYICAMILARAVFTAGRFPTFTAQSSVQNMKYPKEAQQIHEEAQRFYSIVVRYFSQRHRTGMRLSLSRTTH